MSFDTAGFLSEAMDSFRTSLRAVPSYKLWFEFAEDLIRLGLDMLRDLETPRHDSQKLTASALFVRAHQSLQAAMLLAERGMLNDARVVLRSAIEGAIALTALANNAAFLNQMIEAHRFNQRKLARLTLNDPDYRSAYSSAEIAEMEATITEVDALDAAAVAAGRKPLRDINWADVDVQHCKDLYGLMYRLFSGDGAHTNMNAINRFMEFDAGGQLTGLKVGPDTSDMIDVLKGACLMFMWAAAPFAQTYERNDFEAEVQARIQRFAKLPLEEPADVSVVANLRSGVDCMPSDKHPHASRSDVPQ